jgi:hypothetical protein
MTSYLNIMEKALGFPFVLRNATEQFKQFFQKVPQTLPQAFSLASGLAKAVETKVDFAGCRAAVSTYMQEFLAHTPSQPMQPLGSLYPVNNDRRKEEWSRSSKYYHHSRHQILLRLLNLVLE